MTDALQRYLELRVSIACQSGQRDALRGVRAALGFETDDGERA